MEHAGQVVCTRYASNAYIKWREHNENKNNGKVEKGGGKGKREKDGREGGRAGMVAKRSGR